MTFGADIRLRLGQSTLRRCAILTAASAVVLSIYLLAAAMQRSGFLIGLICICAALLVIAVTWRDSAHPAEISLLSSGHCWLHDALAQAQSQDAEPPRLAAYQRYLGLLLLTDSERRSLLIWPDQLTQEQARLVRIWLARHAR